jgi:hypothetical protein
VVGPEVAAEAVAAANGPATAAAAVTTRPRRTVVLRVLMVPGS